MQKHNSDLLRLSARGVSLATAMGLAVVAGWASPAFANPQGSHVVHGQVGFNRPNTATLEITNSPNAIINWNNFSIGKGETTKFIQQGATSQVLNRVVGQDPSAILGRLISNGRVFLINPNGMAFGPQSVIDTAGFIGSTLNMTDEDFLSGNYKFKAGTKAGKLVNEGLIRSRGKGGVYLIAPSVENSGIIRTDSGNLVLAAGRKVTLSSLDLHHISVEVQAPDDEVLNLGQLLTGGGAIGIFAGSIRNHGVIEAKSVHRDEKGNVVLAASKDVALAKDSLIKATAGKDGGRVRIAAGDKLRIVEGAAVQADGESGGEVALEAKGIETAGSLSATGTTGKGGAVLVKSEATTAETESARIDVSGGEGGRVSNLAGEKLAIAATYSAEGAEGTGGRVELSAPEVELADVSINASGRTGGGVVRIGGEYRGGRDLETDELANARTLHATEGTVIEADALEQGDGGEVIVWSDDATRFLGSISARGGAAGGAGGLVETSGAWLDVSGARVDTRAADGSAGTWLLDPHNIIINATGDAGGETTPPDPSFFPDYVSGVDDSFIKIEDLVEALKLTDVTIATGDGGTQEGDITLVDDFDFDGIGADRTLSLYAHDDIGILGNIFDGTSGGDSLSLYLEANSDALGSPSGDGFFLLPTLVSIGTQGGDLTTSGVGFYSFGPIVTKGGDFSLSITGDVLIRGGVESMGGDIDIVAEGPVVLDGPLNTIGGSVTLEADSIDGLDNLSVSESLTLTLRTSGVVLPHLSLDGDLEVTARGEITQDCFDSFCNGLFIGGTSTFDAGAKIDLDVDGIDNEFQGPVSLITDNDAEIWGSNELELGTSSVGGVLSVYAGSIAQSGPLTIGGASFFYAFDDSTNSIKLDNRDNDFQDSVWLDNFDQENNVDNDVSVTDRNALILGPSFVGGDFTVSTGGAITQIGDVELGALEISGTSSFNAGANPIDLSDENNDFEGPVSLETIGDNDAILTSAHDLVLGQSSVGGDLSASSVSFLVSQSGPIESAGLEVSAGTFISLEHEENDVDRLTASALAVSDPGDISFRDKDGFEIAGGVFVASGSVTLQAEGPVTQSQPIRAEGLELLGSGSYTLNNGSNDVQTLAADTRGDIAYTDANGFALGSVGGTEGLRSTGAVSLEADSIDGLDILNLFVSDALSLTLRASGVSLPQLTLTRYLKVSTQEAITQNGALIVGGTSEFDAAGTINLSTNGNDLQGPVSLYTTGANDAALTDVNGLILGDSRVGGNLSLTALGPVSQSGPLVAAGLELFGAGFTLDNSENDVDVFAASAFSGGVSFTDKDDLVVGAVGATVGIDTPGDLTLRAQSLGVQQRIDAGGSALLETTGSIALAGDIAANRIFLNAGTSTVVTDTSTLTADELSLGGSVTGTQSLALLTGTTGKDVVIGGSGDTFMPAANVAALGGYEGRLSVGGSAPPDPARVSAGDISVGVPLSVPGDLTLVSLGDVEVLRGGLLRSGGTLTVIALDQTGQGDILDAGPGGPPFYFDAQTIVLFANDEIGRVDNPLTIRSGPSTVHVGAGSRVAYLDGQPGKMLSVTQPITDIIDAFSALGLYVAEVFPTDPVTYRPSDFSDAATNSVLASVGAAEYVVERVDFLGNREIEAERKRRQFECSTW